MLDLLSNFFSTVSSLINFFVNSISSLIQIISKIPSYVGFLTSAIGSAPSILMPFLLTSLFIYVLFFFLNK